MVDLYKIHSNRIFIFFFLYPHIWNVGQTDFGFCQPLKKSMLKKYTEKNENSLSSYFIGLMFKYNL